MRHVPGFYLARAMLLVLTPVLAACQASLQAYPERPFDNAIVTTINSVEVVQEFYRLPTEDQRREYRNALIAVRIAAIDISYRLFEEQLFREGTVRNIATDWTLLGLAGAGATVASSGTQEILAGISGGLVGARAAFDKNALFDRALPSLVAKMEASRRSVEERLLNGMELDASAYGIIPALTDLEAYYNAGTLPGAILNVAGDAGVLKAQIQQRRTFSARSLDDAGKGLIPLLTGASGTLDSARVKQLRTCLSVIGLPSDILIIDFLYGGEFIAERRKALTCMQATPIAMPTAVTSDGRAAEAAPPTSRRRLSRTETGAPPTSGRREPVCKDSGSVIPPLCPPLSPELQSRRKQIADNVRKIGDVDKLAAISHALGLLIPVPTVKCMQRDVIGRVEQACTSPQLEELAKTLSNPPANNSPGR
jgi:hypothetical protein